MIPAQLDERGNLHLGPYTRNSDAKLTIDLDGSDSGIALDIAAPTVTASRRVAIKLGDFTIGQDTLKAGDKSLSVLDASGNKVATLAGVGQQAGMMQTELFRANIPLIIAPGGSMAAHGVWTQTTANPLTYLSCFVWMPTGKVFTASPAGWYYAVYTTTQAATFYNNMWDGASNPVVPTSLVDTGTSAPGACTGATAEAAYITLPFAAAGLNSLYEVYIKFNQTNNANAKTVLQRLTNVSGQTFFTSTLTSLAEADCATYYNINGVADKETVYGVTNGATAFVRQALTLYTSAMTSAAFALAITHARATATDVVVIENFQILHYR